MKMTGNVIDEVFRDSGLNKEPVPIGWQQRNDSPRTYVRLNNHCRAFIANEFDHVSTIAEQPLWLREPPWWRTEAVLASIQALAIGILSIQPGINRTFVPRQSAY